MEEKKKPRACRNLTAELNAAGDNVPEDEESRIQREEATRAVFEKELNEKKEKWNFDFVNEVPLEGDWEYKLPSENFDDLPQPSTPPPSQENSRDSETNESQQEPEPDG